MRSHIKVKEESEDRLHLVKETGLYSYTLLVAFTAIGYGAASYSQDCCFWKAVYISFGIFIGLACMEDYEECIVNKKDKDVRFIKLTVWDRIIQLINNKPPDVVVFDMDDIVDVKVKEETVTYFGKGYKVVLYMNSGMEMSVTEAFIFGKTSSEQVAIAEKIKAYLDIHLADLSDDSTCSSDQVEDGFEHITQEVLQEELKTQK